MSSSGVISGTPTVSGTFSYTVTVKDSSGNTGTANCLMAPKQNSVTVNCATITASEGVSITPVTLAASGGTGTGYTFTATGLPAGFTMSSTGTISGTPSVSGTFSYTVTVKDSAGNRGTANCSVTVGAPPTLTITCPTATGVTSGQIMIGGLSYGETYQIWGSNTLGQLGTQLYSGTWNDNGNPVNIPNCGQYKYISVKPTSGNCLINSVSFNTAACQITVAPSPISATCAAGTATDGVAYSSAVVVTGGTAPYTFAIASGSLPSGLTLNSSTGAITGTPAVSGTFSYSVKVTDAKGNSATTSNCGITVAPPPALTITCPTATGTVGAGYSSGATAAGGVPPYTFSIATGSLPPGLALNPSTGAITGTPTSPGTYSFSIKVTDSFGQSTVSSCSQAYGTGQWNFNTRVGSLGNSYGYTFSGIPVTAYGYSSNGYGGNGSSAGLCGHNDSQSTYGVGIQGASSNYIDTNHWVTLDISQAIAAGATSGQFVILGLGWGEGYSVWGSNTLGQLGTQLYSGGSGDNGNAVSIPNFGQYKYISVKATSGNCLLGSVGFSITACQITIAAAVSNPVTNGDCGSIGFWQNSDGQNLITGANGGWYSHNLANWLATQFPYLYGSRSSNDLTNKTNQDVANLYMSFFGESSKTDAQIMSAALSCYFTSSQLGGNSGGQWGFNSSSNGTGSKYYNVSSYGSAIGLSNNQSYTVMQLLQQCNTSKQNGTYNGTVCGSIFSGINQSGKIY